ncbi:hypothetical protein D4L85_18900 [Chryseolinea soli]|uniref:Uncharacterized protein n=2 Tax=Chryseolinea soli TaxID=2321403 RepID=A0A385SUT1_9BACT|nr:hypothetical protein D4L85_18900 [Chryseolinea soli]
MDQETARYIVTYFSKLLTDLERQAIRHTRSNIKLEDIDLDDPLMRAYKRNGWLYDDPGVLDLLKHGYDAFEITAANRILSEQRDKVFFNNCPKCGKLARTPQAKQCRHCGWSWHG